MSENESTQIVVVGASAAGLRAAARARRRLPKAKVLVIDQDSFISYGACGLPYFLSGDIESPNKLRETAYGVIRDPDFFRDAKEVEILTETRVQKIDPQARKVFCEALKTGEALEFSYDKLVLACGASPIIPFDVPKDSARVKTFKTLHDAIALKQSLQKGEIGRVGIVGAGFIGCELAEAFGSLWGAEVVLMEAAPHILPYLLDVEMAKAVEADMKAEGVEIHTQCPVEGIEETEAGVVIKTGRGSFEADCAVIALGVRPNTGPARECGLTMGESGGIVVDDSLRTSDKNIFAAGDCIEVKHLITGEAFVLPLGSLANRQGRVVGSNLGGRKERFAPVLGSSAIKIFDTNVASTGLTEAAAGAAGIDAGCAWGTFTDRADYYPENENIHLKLVYEKATGRLLGLQGFGKGEVVKRVDVFAALLQNQGAYKDLQFMEFAYAPPFAPAVDPLFALGCAARNAEEEGVKCLPPDASMENYSIIDVRLATETEAMPIKAEAVLNIPFEEIRARYEEIPRDKPVLCVCSKGLRSSEAARFLIEKGFNNVVYLGGGLLMRR